MVKMKIKDRVVRTGKGANKTMWLIVKATDMKSAMSAIIMARATGSVGATETTQNAEKPFGDGKLLKYAAVQRIEFVEPN